MPHQDKSQKFYRDLGINLEWPYYAPLFITILWLFQAFKFSLFVPLCDSTQVIYFSMGENSFLFPLMHHSSSAI